MRSQAYSVGQCSLLSGTPPGCILYEGEREEFVRPRGRCKSDDDASHEIELASYRFAKDPEQLQTQIVQAIKSSRVR